MIERRGDKFVVLSESGKVLGTHDTLAEAKQQLNAIHISQARGSGHNIPFPSPKKKPK